MSETPEDVLRALLKERLPEDLPPIAQELIDGMIEVVREAVATSTAETAKVYEARLEREMVRAAELEAALREIATMDSDKHPSAVQKYAMQKIARVVLGLEKPIKSA